MTNLHIIVNEAVANKIFTEDEVVKMLEERGELPLHTFAAWGKRGYKVKKGAKAAIKTRLWKHKSSTRVTDDGEEIETSNCYLYTAYLFTQDSVERA